MVGDIEMASVTVSVSSRFLPYVPIGSKVSFCLKIQTYVRYGEKKYF